METSLVTLDEKKQSKKKCRKLNIAERKAITNQKWQKEEIIF
jgi:hypothetical protein